MDGQTPAKLIGRALPALDRERRYESFDDGVVHALCQLLAHNAGTFRNMAAFLG